MINVLKNTRRIVIGFIILSIIFFLYSDKIVSSVSGLSPFWVLFIGVFFNPIYLIFIFSLFESYGFKGMISGILIGMGVDLMSLPHLLTKNGVVSTQFSNLITDTSIWNLLPSFLKFNIDGFNFGILILYILVPAFLVILSLMILHKRKFKQIFMKSV